MIAFFANTFGYLLNFLYNIIENYGMSIILFTIIIKLIMLPLSIKQQVTMKKTAKIQEKMKVIQDKYKNDPERLNQEAMGLYKSEKMSPFSGCFSSIVQLVLLFSVFYLVSSPLTYMKKIDPEVISNYKNEIKISDEENGSTTAYPEINIIKQKGNIDENVNINMHFLGLDLSNVPMQNLKDPTVYIIPVLYVISSFVSLRITNSMTKKKKEEDKDKKEEKTEMDTIASMNRNMMFIMPIMSVTISMIAPLGLALYWLTNNVLMILERVFIDKYMKKKEEKQSV